jgi:hypothetical protein
VSREVAIGDFGGVALRAIQDSPILSMASDSIPIPTAFRQTRLAPSVETKLASHLFCLGTFLTMGFSTAY